MNLNRKLELALQGVKSIATHDDVSTHEVEAYLDKLMQGVKAEKAKIRPRKHETRKDKLVRLAKAAMDVFK